MGHDVQQQNRRLSSFNHLFLCPVAGGDTLAESVIRTSKAAFQHLRFRSLCPPLHPAPSRGTSELSRGHRLFCSSSRAVRVPYANQATYGYRSHASIFRWTRVHTQIRIVQSCPIYILSSSLQPRLKTEPFLSTRSKRILATLRGDRKGTDIYCAHSMCSRRCV